MKNFKKFVPLAIVAASFLFSSTAVFADQPSASLSLSSGAYMSGAIFQDTIYEDSDTTSVNVVDAELKYNPSELELESVDTSTSAFLNAVPSTPAAGQISIVRYNLTKISGKAVVAVLNFKQISGSTSRVDFLSSSSILSGKPIWDGVDNAGIYTFTAPPPKPSPPANQPTPSPAPTSASQTTVTKPQAKPKDQIQAGDTLAALNTLHKASLTPLQPAIIENPDYDKLELYTSAGSLVYLSLIGWVIRSNHPVASRVRAVRVRPPRLRKRSR